MLYPTSDIASLSIDSSLIPACATLTSLPEQSKTSLYLTYNNTVMKLEANVHSDVITVSVQQCGWVTVYFVDECLLEMLEFEFSSVFTCVVSSLWETKTRNFTIASSRTKPTQNCAVGELTTESSVPSSSGEPSTSPISPGLSLRANASDPTGTSKPVALTSSPLPTPTIEEGGDGEGKGDSPVAVIAGATVVAGLVIVAVVTVICALEIVRRRGKKSRSPRQMMYQLPEINDSFAPEPTPRFPPQPSLIDTHVNILQPLSLSSQHQFTHNGVLVSRQMAKVATLPVST